MSWGDNDTVYGRDIPGDKVYGDKVRGDKVYGSKIDIGPITNGSTVAIGTGARVYVDSVDTTPLGVRRATLIARVIQMDAATLDRLDALLQAAGL